MAAVLQLEPRYARPRRPTGPSTPAASASRAALTGPIGSPIVSHRPRPARRHQRAVYRRRRVLAALVGLGLVLTVARAGAALGGSSLATPERLPHVQTRGRRSRATRCGRSRGASRPATTSAPDRRRDGAGARHDHDRAGRADHRSRRPEPSGARHGVEQRDACERITVVACAVRTAGRTTTRSSTRACREEAVAIRRRRECLACGRRFTTYERVEEAPLLVAQARRRDRAVRPRPSCAPGIERSATRPARRRDASTSWSPTSKRSCGRSAARSPSDRVGMAVLERLRALDHVAYLRFASVYKGFEDLADFEREVGELQKTTEPKQR